MQKKNIDNFYTKINCNKKKRLRLFSSTFRYISFQEPVSRFSQVQSSGGKGPYLREGLVARLTATIATIDNGNANTMGSIRGHG